MGTTVNLNGTNYTIPAVGEGNWGTQVTNYLIALSTGVLQKAGGSFTLTADADFGATYGLKSAYFAARSAGASAGFLRAANNTSVSWRNAANNADLNLKVNASDILEYNGNPLVTLALGAADTVLRMNAGGTAYEFSKLVNANIDASAAIAYSKLNLLTSIVNADIAVAAAIAYTKLADNTACSLLGRSANSSGANAGIAASTNNTVLKRAGDALTFDTIVNADVNSTAAIVFTKMAALTASRVPVLNASGFIEASSITATELGYLTGLSAAVQTQLDGKVADTGDTMTGNLIMDNAKEIRFSELDANGSHYIGLKAPDSVTADKTFTLPDGDGSANQVLKTDGSGNLGWSTIVAADANNNISADAFIPGFTTTATAAGTTTLTVSSNEIQEFTGTTTQTVTMPTTSIVAGQRYKIINNSTGVVTVQSSGANTIIAMPANSSIVLTALVATPTTAANWDISSAIGVYPGSTSGATIATGYVGEYIESVAGSSTAQTSSQANDSGATKITLGVGIWDIQASSDLVPTGVTSHVKTLVFVGTATGNSLAGLDARNTVTHSFNGALTNAEGIKIATPMYRVRITSGTTDYYVKSYSVFGAGTMTAQGLITARRVA